MKIKQLLIQSIAQKIGGFPLFIKTYKKNWQTGEIWWQQVICMDETGEIPVDIKVGSQYNPLRGRTREIKVIVAEIQEAEYLGKDRKKLVVDQFELPEPQVGEWEEYAGMPGYSGSEPPKVIRGKIKCWLVAAKVGTKASLAEVKGFADDPLLIKIIDSIMDG